MKVTIKDFNVDMEVKNKGIEFEIHSPDGSRHLGDLVLNKSYLIWCPGRTTPENGYRLSWAEAIKRFTDT